MANPAFVRLTLVFRASSATLENTCRARTPVLALNSPPLVLPPHPSARYVLSLRRTCARRDNSEPSAKIEGAHAGVILPLSAQGFKIAYRLGVRAHAPENETLRRGMMRATVGCCFSEVESRCVIPLDFASNRVLSPRRRFMPDRARPSARSVISRGQHDVKARLHGRLQSLTGEGGRNKRWEFADLDGRISRGVTSIPPFASVHRPDAFFRR